MEVVVGDKNPLGAAEKRKEIPVWGGILIIVGCVIVVILVAIYINPAVLLTKNANDIAAEFDAETAQNIFGESIDEYNLKIKINEAKIKKIKTIAENVSHVIKNWSVLNPHGQTCVSGLFAKYKGGNDDLKNFFEEVNNILKYDEKAIGKLNDVELDKKYSDFEAQKKFLYDALNECTDHSQKTTFIPPISKFEQKYNNEQYYQSYSQ